MSKIDVKCDNTVPVPSPKVRSHRYPWSDMQIGDSFFAPVKFVDTEREMIKRGTVYVKRPVTENGQPGFRVWRTA